MFGLLSIEIITVDSVFVTNLIFYCRSVQIIFCLRHFRNLCVSRTLPTLFRLSNLLIQLLIVSFYNPFYFYKKSRGVSSFISNSSSLNAISFVFVNQAKVLSILLLFKKISFLIDFLYFKILFYEFPL